MATEQHGARLTAADSAAESTATTIHRQGTASPRRPDEPRPPLWSSCADATCPDCRGRGRLDDLRPCDRRHQWLRRVGYPQMFGTAA